MHTYQLCTVGIMCLLSTNRLTPSSGLLWGLGRHWYVGFWCFCQLHIPPREKTPNVVSFYVPSLLLLFSWTKRLLQPSISDINPRAEFIMYVFRMNLSPGVWLKQYHSVSKCHLALFFISVSKNDIGILKLTETETMCRTGMLDCSKLRPAASLFNAQIQCCHTSRCCTAPSPADSCDEAKGKSRASSPYKVKICWPEAAVGFFGMISS